MGTNPRTKETDLEGLFEAAHKDANLKMRLLQDPVAVGKEWGVEIGGREAERLQKLGAFAELANEAKRGLIFRCDPRVCYPVTVWLKWEILELVREIVVPPIFYPPQVFYPAPIIGRTEQILAQRLGLQRVSRS